MKLRTGSTLEGIHSLLQLYKGDLDEYVNSLCTSLCMNDATSSLQEKTFKLLHSIVASREDMPYTQGSIDSLVAFRGSLDGFVWISDLDNLIMNATVITQPTAHAFNETVYSDRLPTTTATSNDLHHPVVEVIEEVINKSTYFKILMNMTQDSWLAKDYSSAVHCYRQ